jgi:hypothetical protein
MEGDFSACSVALATIPNGAPVAYIWHYKTAVLASCAGPPFRMFRLGIGDGPFCVVVSVSERST